MVIDNVGCYRLGLTLGLWLFSSSNIMSVTDFCVNSDVRLLILNPLYTLKKKSKMLYYL